jgi:hypothetical protein
VQRRCGPFLQWRHACADGSTFFTIAVVPLGLYTGTRSKTDKPDGSFAKARIRVASVGVSSPIAKDTTAGALHREKADS